MPNEEPLVLTFVPALVVLLLRAEQDKGSPLTNGEVLSIRDNGACVALPQSQVRLLAERRGYDDIDPEQA
jgi:hypothetical protein